MTNLKQHLINSLEKAEKLESKISDDIYNILGMSGKKTRNFYNNLCSFPDARYLEIGCWKGSTICSAMYKNNMKCVAIDKTSQKIFLENFNKFKGENDARFIHKDCWNVDIKELEKFNIFMYDGDHSSESHEKALTYYYDCLDDTFIFIIDDWNRKDVRKGTYSGIEKTNLKIIYEKIIFTDKTKQGIEDVVWEEGQKGWHNGIAIFLVQKQNR